MDRLRSMLWSLIFAVAMVSFLTSLATPGFAGPVVKITQPAHQQMVTGQIVIMVAYESDSNRPITRLEIYVDGKLGYDYTLVSPKTRGVQSFNWDFTLASASAHTISARAIDDAGAVGSAEITVNVTRAETTSGADRVPPVVNIYYPAQGARVAGEIEIRVDATDNVGVKYVFFYIDGKLHKMIMNAPPFVDVWDTTRVADGPHVLQARAMDEAENAANSAEVTVFVENHTMTSTPATALAGAGAPAAGAGAPVPTVVPDTVVPTAPPLATVAGGPASATSAPVLTPPQEPVTRTTFGVTSPTLSAPTAAARREVERAPSEIQVARYGYLPTLSAALEPTTRTSRPETMLAALPSMQGASGAALQLGSGIPEALGPEVGDYGTPTGATVGPRLTTPGRLSALSAASDYGRISALDQTMETEPMVAALPGTPRLTTPRTSLTELEYLAARSGGSEAGWVRLEAALELRPSDERPAPRVTAPVRELVPTETLAAPDLLETTLRPAVTAATSADEPLVALAAPSPRLTAPGALDTGPGLAVASSDTGVQALQVAVVPAAARRAAIPAEGRLTTPRGVPIAPVAMTRFEDIQILFDNARLELLASPEFRDGISIAPLREIFEATDGVLYWFPVEKRVRAVNSNTEINLRIGDPRVRVNDQVQVLEVAPYIKQGRTMVPLQFIADTLDVTVTFNPQTGQICLTSNKF